MIFFQEFVFELILNHREHSPGLSGHSAEGFTEMNLEISEMEALKGIDGRFRTYS